MLIFHKLKYLEQRIFLMLISVIYVVKHYEDTYVNHLQISSKKKAENYDEIKSRHYHYYTYPEKNNKSSQTQEDTLNFSLSQLDKSLVSRPIRD